MASVLYKRKAVLQIDTVQIESGDGGLGVAFEVEKELPIKKTPKPNTCHVRVWNLTKATRDALSDVAAKTAALTKTGRGVYAKLEVGYGDTTCSIFEGDLRILYHESDGPDIVTHALSGDGEWAYVSARINKSWAPGTSVSTVIREIANALGLGKGNIESKIQAALLDGAGDNFPGGTVASGSAVKELTRLTKSAGLSWSIQDGTLQFLADGKSLDGTAIEINPQTGMVGSPTIDNKKIVSFKTLIVPDLFPGRQIKLESAHLSGVYVVQKVKYTGDTYGQEWYADCEAKVPT